MKEIDLRQAVFFALFDIKSCRRVMETLGSGDDLELRRYPYLEISTALKLIARAFLDILQTFNPGVFRLAKIRANLIQLGAGEFRARDPNLRETDRSHPLL